jgi:hypothetical protein
MSANRLTAVFLAFDFRLRQGYGGQVVSAQLSQRVGTPSPKPRQKPKILAAHRYIFSLNALNKPKAADSIFRDPKLFAVRYFFRACLEIAPASAH